MLFKKNQHTSVINSNAPESYTEQEEENMLTI